MSPVSELASLGEAIGDWTHYRGAGQDHGKLREVSDDLERLGKEGPWTEETGIDFLKKTAEGMPVVGGFLKALWG